MKHYGVSDGKRDKFGASDLYYIDWIYDAFYGKIWALFYVIQQSELSVLIFVLPFQPLKSFT